jgi:hypothetical protein
VAGEESLHTLVWMEQRRTETKAMRLYIFEKKTSSLPPSLVGNRQPVMTQDLPICRICFKQQRFKRDRTLSWSAV